MGEKLPGRWLPALPKVMSVIGPDHHGQNNERKGVVPYRDTPLGSRSSRLERTTITFDLVGRSATLNHRRVALRLRFTGYIQSSPNEPIACLALVLHAGLSNTRLLGEERRLHTNTPDSHTYAGNEGQAAWLPLKGSPRPLRSPKGSEPSVFTPSGIPGPGFKPSLTQASLFRMVSLGRPRSHGGSRLIQDAVGSGSQRDYLVKQ